MYTYRIVWDHSRSDWITWNVPKSTDATKMKKEFPTYMWENASGSPWGRPIATNTTYMRTRMNAPATGLMMEYKTKSHGSVQFESISHPSHAAVLKVRQYVLIDAVRSASPLASRASLGMRGSTLRGSRTTRPCRRESRVPS